jgi:hypothetical protein
MDALTNAGCRLILNEVFECDELEALVARGDAFFSMLPPPDMRPPLAKSSPLNDPAPLPPDPPAQASSTQEGPEPTIEQ